MSLPSLGALLLGSLLGLVLGMLVGYPKNQWHFVVRPQGRASCPNITQAAAATASVAPVPVPPPLAPPLAPPVPPLAPPVPPLVAEWPPQHRNNDFAAKQPFVSAKQANPCIPQSHHLAPRGDYEYHSSEMEKAWFAEPQHGKVCELAVKQEAQVRLWLNYTASDFKANKRPKREPTEKEASVLSYFSFPRPDGSRVKRYIEPLFGTCRYPLWLCILKPNKKIMDLTYLLPESACTPDGNSVRGVFFDLGAGTDVNGFQNFNYAHGNAWAGSIQLFFNMFLDRCIEFQSMFAWEVRKIDHAHFWDPLPDHIRSRLRLYNRPVNENQCPASPEGSFAERGSFLRMLKSTVKVEDYVVVKVDIDSMGINGGPELAIVESIAHLPELSELVDEIFFEYHFDFQGKIWLPGDYGGRTVDTALNLMLRLREAGIRSHFWV